MFTFEKLSELITVVDICEPLFGKFDGSSLGSYVFQEWIDLCTESGLDPMDQIASVTHDGKIVGWVGFDMLEEDKTLQECMEPLTGDILMSSETQLMEAIQTVCMGDNYVYLVLRGNRLVGYLGYAHFYRLPFRLCLFALLMDLEKRMLDIIKLNPSLFLSSLSKGRLNRARDVYRHRGYNLTAEGIEYDLRLVDCTTFIDKFKMLRKEAATLQRCPHIKDELSDKAERLRNELAHPGGKGSDLLSIERKDLLHFIRWAQELYAQLDDYYSSTVIVI